MWTQEHKHYCRKCRGEFLCKSQACFRAKEGEERPRDYIKHCAIHREAYLKTKGFKEISK